MDLDHPANRAHPLVLAVLLAQWVLLRQVVRRYPGRPAHRLTQAHLEYPVPLDRLQAHVTIVEVVAMMVI